MCRIRYTLVFGAKTVAENGLKQALSELESYNKRLSDLSQFDELASLNNPRGFICFGQQRMDMALRMNKNCLVVISGMDGLTRINDTWGRDAGDRAIVVVDVDPEFADTLRTRMDKLVACYNATSGDPFILAIGSGAVVFKGWRNRNPEALLALADSALYVEKRPKQRRTP